MCERSSPNPPKLYKRMKRVEAQYLGSVPDEVLIERLGEHEQFLTIVNTPGTLLNCLPNCGSRRLQRNRPVIPSRAR